MLIIHCELNELCLLGVSSGNIGKAQMWNREVCAYGTGTGFQQHPVSPRLSRYILKKRARLCVARQESTGRLRYHVKVMAKLSIVDRDVRLYSRPGFGKN